MMRWSRRFFDPIKVAERVLIVVAAIAAVTAFAVEYFDITKQDVFFFLGLGMLLLVLFQLTRLTTEMTRLTTETRTSFEGLPGRLRDAIMPKGGSAPVGPKPSEDASQEPRPSGTGAFGGMVLGAGVGLALGGPVGVFIGGLIGALVGNQIEYEDLRKKQPPKP